MAEGPGSATPAWHPDPFGRHIFRYWDGARWTEHVSDHGDSAADPVPEGLSAPPPSVPAVLESTKLSIEYSGPNARGGWPVFDERSQHVGWVRQPGGFTVGRQPYYLVTTEERPVLTVTGAGTGLRTRLDVPLAVTGPEGYELGRFGPPESTWQVTFGTTRSKPRDVTYTFSCGNAVAGRLRGTVTRFEGTGVVDDAVGNQIATITQSQEKISTFKERRLFVLERSSTLTDPVRSLVVAAPLALHTGISNEQADWQRRTF
jgi:hypothetical protein